MNAWALRALFAGLLLAALATKMLASPGPERDVQTMLLSLLSDHGLSGRLEPAAPGSILQSTIAFTAPGCDGEVRVTPVQINLQEAPLFDSLAEQGQGWRLVYLGQTWTEPDRLGLRLAWIKHKVLAALGRGPFAPDKTVLLVVVPEACQVADSIDWQRVWYR
jgi:hypothetical protein